MNFDPRPRYDPESWAQPTTHPLPGWLRYLLALIQAANQKAQPPRAAQISKAISYRGRPAYLLKGRLNRLRIVIQAGEKDQIGWIHAYVSIPTPAKPGSPYLPRYPTHGDIRIHTRTYFNDEEGLEALCLDCLKWLEEYTVYQEPDFFRIPLSTDISKGFMYGVIVGTSYHTHDRTTNQPDPHWDVDILEGQLVAATLDAAEKAKRYTVKASALKIYDVISPGYILIYKSSEEAEIASIGDVRLYCTLEP